MEERSNIPHLDPLPIKKPQKLDRKERKRATSSIKENVRKPPTLQSSMHKSCTTEALTEHGEGRVGQRRNQLRSRGNRDKGYRESYINAKLLRNGLEYIFWWVWEADMLACVEG